MIRINDHLSIPKREIQFVYGTSSGPGGQHVNKVETKATVLFSIDDSRSLSDSQKNRIKLKISTRINKSNVMRVSSSKYKSQIANRKAALKRFVELVEDALLKPVKRVKSKIPKSQKMKRLENKRKRGDTKKLRLKVKPASD